MAGMKELGGVGKSLAYDVVDQFAKLKIIIIIIIMPL